MENRIWWVASPDKDQERTKTRKGLWTKEEDMQLIGYISIHGEGRWDFLAKAAGLKRTGKSCRLRWNNCLRPDLKRSKIGPEEERLITKLHGRWGNRWSRIARSLPGRTDNEIKNYWRTRLNRKQNLQADSGSNCMDGDNRVQIEGSIGSHSLTSSSQRSPELDCSAESSSSFTMQTSEGIAGHTNKTPYQQDYIWAQAVPFSEGDYEIALQVEIHDVSSQINNDRQPGISSQEHSGGLDNLAEKSLLNNFSATSLATLIFSELFAADGATQDAKIPHSLSCIVDSPDTLSDDEYYMIDYSDVLWNMDAEDDCFISSPHSTPCVDRGSY